MATLFTLRHSLRVILAIGWTDFILKYRGSFLGYLWSLASPLVKFGVILYVFGPYLKTDIPEYPLYLFLGIIIWEHFATTTSACMTMLFDKEQIIKCLAFPRILLIFAVGWTNIIVFCTHLVVFLFFAWFSGIAWNVSIAYMLLIGIQMSFLAIGIGMVLSANCLRYRDIPHLWNIFTQVLFWLTPVMYPYRASVSALSEAATFIHTLNPPTLGTTLSAFVHLQPLSILMHDARRVLLYPMTWGTPTVEHAVGVTIVCGTIFLLGWTVFQRRQVHFVQEY